MEIPTASSLVKVTSSQDDKISTIINEIQNKPNRHLYNFTFDGSITDDLVKSFEDKEYEVTYTITYKKGKKLTELAIINPKVPATFEDFGEMFNGEKFKKKMEFTLGDDDMMGLGNLLKDFMSQ